MTSLWKRGAALAAAAAIAAVGLAVTPAMAQAPEKKKVKLGVGGKPALYYLPLTLTERLGFFKKEGLDVEISDFAGGSKSLQALIGGSVDVVTGAYEHTIHMQAKGQDIRAVVELGRYPGISLAIRTSKAKAYKSPADLKGMKIGVTAPGSSTNMVVWYLMSQAGLKPTDASFIGVGAGPSAVAAIKKGEIDAISNIDPVISRLEKDKEVVVVAESRSTAGTTKLYGGPMPAAVLYIKQDFIAKNPNTVQALVNAFYRTLKWLEKATPEQVTATVPEAYYLGDKDLYIKSVKGLLESYSRTGVVSTDGQERSLKFLKTFIPKMKDAKIDLTKTWDGRFIAKAAKTVK
ncbi:MAG: ABC transporter substrate-binding protein [Hyphomicrobiaceae bacterium]|nr:ABC transporter substrate-binding protein [Hyphomicrobiaceae bacterium]